MQRIATLAAFVFVSSAGYAAYAGRAFTPTVAPFAPTVGDPTFFKEGFESVAPLAPCIPNVFQDSAGICAVTPDSVQRLTTLTVGSCTVAPQAGTFFANVTGGIATVDFAGRPVEQFGGFFSTTAPATVTMDFYDSFSALIGTTSVATGCGSVPAGWTWLGAGVTTPTAWIDRVEIYTTALGEFQIDAMQADYYTDGPVTYCEPTITTNGCTGTLSYSGVPGLGTLDFVVSASGLESNKATIFFYSIAGPQKVAFGTCFQYLCVKPGPVWRLGLQNSGVTSPCNGFASVNFDSWMSTAPPAAAGQPFTSGTGIDFYMQAWFRDPPSCTASGTTNAIVFRLVD